MADTYKKVYIHMIFAVERRREMLNKSWRTEVFKYITGIINNRGHYSLAVNGVEDHIHIFFDYNLNELIPDLVREIKKASTNFIQRKYNLRRKFQWQDGYGVFSHSADAKSSIIEYVKNQEEHHKKTSFRDEYLGFLKEYGIEYKEEYVFDFGDE